MDLKSLFKKVSEKASKGFDNLEVEYGKKDKEGATPRKKRSLADALDTIETGYGTKKGSNVAGVGGIVDNLEKMAGSQNHGFLGGGSKERVGGWIYTNDTVEVSALQHKKGKKKKHHHEEEYVKPRSSKSSYSVPNTNSRSSNYGSSLGRR